MCLQFNAIYATNMSMFHWHLRCGILQRILPKQTLVGRVAESALSGGHGKAPGDVRSLRWEPKEQTKFLTYFLRK